MSELKEMFEKLETKLDGRLDELDDRIRENGNKSLEHHEATRKRLDLVSNHVSMLWRKVNGSDPPPPKNGGPPEASLRPIPLDEQVSSNSLEVAALQGHVIALDANMEKFRHEVRRELGEVKTMNQAQNRTMAVGAKGRDFLFSREGVKAVGSLVAGLTGLFVAAATIYALLTGKPVPQLPQPQQVPHAEVR